MPMYQTQAPAKINIDLRIVETRADGYHELDTVFQSLALADRLTLEPTSAPFALACATPGVPTDAGNLAWKGAAAVASALVASLDGWRLHLEKHVPAEAGLGGGSADAVAAARLVLAAWGRPWETAWLADLLAPLGADVPYFVYGGTMRGQGRGDRLTPLPDVADLTVLLVRPDYGVATRDAYGWFDAAGPQAPGAPLTAPADARGWARRWSACRNDLQGPVAIRHGDIDEMAGRLRGAGAVLALMSGSGSTVFGLFAEDAAARAAAHGWPVGWRTWLTRTVDRAAYRALTAVHGPERHDSHLSELRPVV